MQLEQLGRFAACRTTFIRSITEPVLVCRLFRFVNSFYSPFYCIAQKIDQFSQFIHISNTLDLDVKYMLQFTTYNIFCG